MRLDTAQEPGLECTSSSALGVSPTHHLLGVRGGLSLRGVDSGVLDLGGLAVLHDIDELVELAVSLALRMHGALLNVRRRRSGFDVIATYVQEQDGRDASTDEGVVGGEDEGVADGGHGVGLFGCGVRTWRAEGAGEAIQLLTDGAGFIFRENP